MKAISERAALRRARKRAIAESFASLGAEDKLAFIPLADHFAPTEFEVQAYLYSSLAKLGYAVRGEVRTKCATCCFDLVLYHDGRPIRIIEVKKAHASFAGKLARRQERRQRRAQVSKYEKFRIPVDLVQSLREAKIYVSKFHTLAA